MENLQTLNKKPVEETVVHPLMDRQEKKELKIKLEILELITRKIQEFITSTGSDKEVDISALKFTKISFVTNTYYPNEQHINIPFDKKFLDLRKTSSKEISKF